jgi:hypothetical protein
MRDEVDRLPRPVVQAAARRIGISVVQPDLTKKSTM